MSKSWFDDVAKYIQNNLDQYLYQILKVDQAVAKGPSIWLEPCPKCGHRDCCSVKKDGTVGNCFSPGCGFTGSLIHMAEKLHGVKEAREMLAEWTGIPYPYSTYESQGSEKPKHDKRTQQLYHQAIKFYQGQLLKNKPIRDRNDTVGEPGTYQQEVRGHSVETLMKYKVGYCADRSMLKPYLEEHGFNKEEIDKAVREMIGVPEGYFVYPYFDEDGNLVRINGKPFYRKCYGHKDPKTGKYTGCTFLTFEKNGEQVKEHKERNDGHMISPLGFSRGDKVFYVHYEDLNQNKRKNLILVEGENDMYTVADMISKLPSAMRKKFSVAATGGNMGTGMFDSDFLRSFEEIFEAFDNDEGGDGYRKQLDEELPDVLVRRIMIPQPHKDIDEYMMLNERDPEIFKELLDKAKIQGSTHFRIDRVPNTHKWVLKTRQYKLEFSIERFDRRKQDFEGSLIIWKGDTRLNLKRGHLDTMSLSQGIKDVVNPFRFELSEHLKKFYHKLHMTGTGDERKPARSFAELLDVFFYTASREAVQKQLAWYLYKAEDKEHAFLVNELQKAIKGDTERAEIFKEVNGYQNDEVNLFETPPKIRISQSLYPIKGDAYMYFVKLIQDNGSVKEVPCLISNKQKEIRLDLLKRKDPQSLLLIDNKYALPMEVPMNFTPTETISLQHEWVDKWVNDAIPEDHLKPERIILEIESLIRMIYYTTDDIIKVLSLWIYATYFYTMFRSGFPYLMFTGAKGTGKSTLDTIVELTAFNPTYSVHTTESALFRGIHYFGGTYILDELENITDSKKANDNGVATVLKAGYVDKGTVQRTNKDTNMPEGFRVFGPKVISNISGIEDVVADRCIFIETSAAPEEKIKLLQPPEVFTGERRKDAYSISSRAAISALLHFEEVHDIMNTDTRYDTGNLRLTQLLQPLIVMARLVGGDYEKHLKNFYKTDIAEKKNEISMGTLEGKIKHILLHAAEEILDLTDKRWVLSHDRPHDKPVQATGTKFTMDSLHFKLLAEELSGGDANYTFPEIHKAMKNALGKDSVEFKSKVSTRITITDEDLQKKFTNKHPHGNKWLFDARSIIPRQVEMLKYKKEEEEESLF